MCTLTWLFNSDRRGYTLLFNRDELKTRKRAYPPSLTEAINGVSYLAPIDADAGGTWLAVNQYGLTICLLNYYAVESKNSDAIHSRGEVVTQLASCQSIAGIEAALRKMTLENYNGFEIVALHDDIAHWRWDTCQLQKIDAKAPITSSSYNTKAVQESRQEFFNSLDAPNTIDALKAFHSCHLSDNSQVILPRKGVLELARLLLDDEADIAIVIGSNHIRAATENFTFTSKLVDGKFPDYQRVLPRSPDKILMGSRQELRQAFTRTAILSNEKYRGVRLKLTQDTLDILAKGVLVTVGAYIVTTVIFRWVFRIHGENEDTLMLAGRVDR